MADSVSPLARLLGAALGGGGAYIAVWASAWSPALPITIGLVVGMAIAGLLFGPKVWEAVVSLA